LTRHRAALLICFAAALAVATPALGHSLHFESHASLPHCYGSAFTPDGAIRFSTSDDGVVGMFDGETDEFLQALDLRQIVPWPTGGAVAHGKLFVESFSSIVVISVETFGVEALLEQPSCLGSHYGALEVDPSGDLVYAVVGSSTHLSVIDAAESTVIDTIQVGCDLSGLALSPSGDRAYLSSSVDGRFVVVDLADASVIGVTDFTNATDGFLEIPTEVAASPDGRVYVSYVALDGTGRIAVLDRDGILIETVATDVFSTGVDVSFDGEFLVLGNGRVLSTQFFDEAASFNMPVGLSTVAFHPDGKRAYVTNTNSQYSFSIEDFAPLLRPEGVPLLLQRMTLHVCVPMDAGRPYRIFASVGASNGIPLPDGRVFPLDGDMMLPRSGPSGFTAWFRGFEGTLNASGDASGEIVFAPQLLPELGTARTMYVAFATYWGSPPEWSNVKTISNVVTIEVGP
jgi:WD40 repeat protein